MVLYILGNGFDRAHRMNTSYWHFEEFIKANYSDVKILYDAQYVVDNLWSSFEENLAEVDIQHLLDGLAGMFELDEDENDTLNINCDEWFTDEIIKGLVPADELKNFFEEWVEGIVIPIIPSRRKFNFTEEQESLYINFNYTSVLQKLYEIKDEKILHIHGCADSVNYKNIIVGHGKPNYRANKSVYFDEKGEEIETDEIDIGGYADTEEERIMLESIARYINDLKKPTGTIVRELINFLNIRLNRKKLDKICILGHSLGSVDMPYFLSVQNYVGKNVVWEIAYHNKKNVKGMKQRLTEAGLDMTNINFISDRLVSYRLI